MRKVSAESQPSLDQGFRRPRLAVWPGRSHRDDRLERERLTLVAPMRRPAHGEPLVGLVTVGSRDATHAIWLLAERGR